MFYVSNEKCHIGERIVVAAAVKDVFGLLIILIYYGTWTVVRLSLKSHIDESFLYDL